MARERSQIASCAAGEKPQQWWQRICSTNLRRRSCCICAVASRETDTWPLTSIRAACGPFTWTTNEEASDTT
eukprot:3210963-Pleurochrysis_carterae.AAC.1